MNPTAIIIIGHGTKDPRGVSQFLALIEAIQQLDAGHRYYPGFMELAAPSLEEAIKLAVQEGHRELLCQPALLLTAGHAKNDLPAMIRKIAAEYQEVSIHYGPPMELSAEIVSLCAAQVREATQELDRSQATLLVVGRGTSDPDTNSQVSKLARMLEEGLGFSESDVCYYSSTRPRLPVGLERVAGRTVGPIVVFPFILFSGVLDEMLNAELLRVQSLFPTIQWIRTAPFGSHPRFAEAFLQRAKTTIEGSIDMPCLLCKYRAPLPGQEQEVGKPQPSGHHHHHHDEEKPHKHGVCGHHHDHDDHHDHQHGGGCGHHHEHEHHACGHSHVEEGNK